MVRDEDGRHGDWPDDADVDKDGKVWYVNRTKDRNTER